MKTIRIYRPAIISAFAVACCFGAQAESRRSADPDTLLKVDNPSRLVITENRDGSVITVTGKEDNESFQAVVKTDYPRNSSVSSNQSVLTSSRVELPGFEYGGRRGSHGWKCYVDGICIGLSNPTGLSAPKGLQWSKSLEIGWLSCLAVGYSWGSTALTLGLGFDWRNYKITTSDRYLTPTPDKGIDWAAAGTLPEGSHLKNSRLKVFSLQLPLLFRVRIPRSCLRMKLGPVFNFNTHASLKTNYEDIAGNEAVLFTKAINPRRFTLDFLGSVSLSNIVGIYVRYSPMNVMDAADGINFKPLTVGVGIGI